MPEPHQLPSVETRLIARFAPVLPTDLIRGLLAQTYRELYEQSTITTYIDILAERLTRQRLADLERRHLSTATSTVDDGVPPTRITDS